MLKVRTVAGIQLHEACAPVQCSVTRRGPQSHPALAAWQHTPDSHAVMQSCSAADWWPLLQPPVMLSLGAWSRLTAAGLFNTPHTPQHSTAGHGWSSLFSLIQQYGHYRFQQVLLKITLYRYSSCHHFKAYLENKMNTNQGPFFSTRREQLNVSDGEGSAVLSAVCMCTAPHSQECSVCSAMHSGYHLRCHHPLLLCQPGHGGGEGGGWPHPAAGLQGTGQNVSSDEWWMRTHGRRNLCILYWRTRISSPLLKV